MNFDFKTMLSQIKKRIRKLSKHASFAAIIIVLLAYLFLVWRISKLATSEPSEATVTAAEATNKIPRVDKNAVKQIQSLENGNTELHSLFNQARKNPFQE